MDVATLGIATKYQDIEGANRALDRFSGGARKAEGSAKRMGSGATTAARRMVAANDNVAKSVNRLGRVYRWAGAIAAAFGVTLSVSLFTRAIKGAIDTADSLAKLSQRIGIQVQDLGRLRHAASLSGVAMEEMNVGVQMLSRNMSSFAGGATNEASKAFQRLGVSVTDSSGKLRSATEVMAEVADSFVAMPDGAAKTAAAMDLFGRSGARLIPLLNQGAAGLNAMMQEADRLGIVIDSKTAKAAEAFNDNLTRLWAVFRGIVTQMTAHLLPTLQQLSAQLVAAATDSDLMKSASDNLATAMKWVIDVGIRAIATFRGIRAEISGLSDALGHLGNLEFGAARDAWNRGQQEFLDIQRDMEKQLHDLWSGKGDRLDIAEPFRTARPEVEDFGGALEEVNDILTDTAGSSRTGGAAGAARDAITGVGDAARDATQSMQDMTRGFLGDVVDGFKRGASAADTFRKALVNVLDKITSMGLDSITTPMFGEVGSLNLEGKPA